MTLKTWLEEFYSDVVNIEFTDKTAILHSLKKWQGMKKENLAKHNVKLAHGLLRDNAVHPTPDIFLVSADSCALCQLYISPIRHEHEQEFQEECEGCPLRKSLGKRCDMGIDSPYRMFVDENDPDDMIEALEKIAFEYGVSNVEHSS